MSDSLGERRELEAVWRSRLQDARLRLTFARDYVREVHEDLRSGAVALSDGRFGFQHALRAETAALAEYRRVLRIFTDLVINGQIPDEEGCARARSAEIADE